MSTRRYNLQCAAAIALGLALLTVLYLAVANNVLDREEGRELIQRAGANLKENTNV